MVSIVLTLLSAARPSKTDNFQVFTRSHNRAQEIRAEMNSAEFTASVADEAPRIELSAPLAALWWDAKGDWARAHALVDELETVDGMAVHAYLHRKEGSASNADYWYGRAGRAYHRPALEAEWAALVEGLLSSTGRS